MSDNHQHIVVPPSYTKITPAKYLIAFKISLEFYLTIMSDSDVKQLTPGSAAKRELCVGLCDELRQRFKLTDEQNREYMEQVFKWLDTERPD